MPNKAEKELSFTHAQVTNGPHKTSLFPLFLSSLLSLSSGPDLHHTFTSLTPSREHCCFKGEIRCFFVVSPLVFLVKYRQKVHPDRQTQTLSCRENMILIGYSPTHLVRHAHKVPG